jgi:DNA polymerase-3 subunit chi
LLGLTKALDKQVLFYNLQDDNQVDKSICRITNFYYKKKLKILIIGEDKAQIDTLNDLLWTFEQISFLPHSFESEYESTPIVLCMIDNLQSILNKYKFDVLFNLSRNKINLDTVARYFIEIVTSVEKQKLNARDKYAYYKKNKIKVTYEKV